MGYHHMRQLWDKVGYEAENVNSNDDEDIEESEVSSRQEAVLQALQTAQPCSTPAQPELSSVPVTQSEQLLLSEGNISQIGQIVTQPSPEHIFIVESGVSDNHSAEHILSNGSQNENIEDISNYSDGVHMSTVSKNSNLMPEPFQWPEPQNEPHPPDVLQKISPTIQ